jgi:hypothetical protein
MNIAKCSKQQVWNIHLVIVHPLDCHAIDASAQQKIAQS